MNTLPVKAQPLAKIDYTVEGNDDLVRVALLLLEGLAGNVMSGDVWALSMYFAKDKALKYGMSKEAFDAAHEKIAEAILTRKKTNPLHPMF